MKENNPHILGEAPIGKLLVEYSIPAIIGMTLTSLYNIIDSIFIGHGVGALAISGLAITFPLMNLLVAFCTLVGVGGATLSSIRLGQKDKKGAEDILGNVAILCVINAIFYGGLAFIFLEPILFFFGASEATLPYARDFMQVILLGSPISYVMIGLNNIMRATGYPKKAMLSSMLTVGCNIILAPIFIFVLNWGIRGAALATGIGQIVSLAGYLTAYYWKPIPAKVKVRNMKPEKQLCKKVYSIGIPATLSLALPSVQVSALNAILAVYSASYVLVLGAYFKLQTFLYLTGNGVVQGMRPLIGYNYGAGESKRVKEIFQSALFLIVIVMVIGTILCMAVPQALIGLFTGNPETIRLGREALRLISIGFIVSSVSVTVSGALEGLGKGKESLVISLLRYIVVILPLAFILSRLFEAAGVWHAFWITEFVSAVISWIICKKEIFQ